jgi:phosphoribosylanthranilate isomerase
MGNVKSNATSGADTSRRVTVKVCGLTRVAEAEACVAAGADAIGCVFYPKSPRHVSDDRAADISRAVAAGALSVGVFVNAGFDAIMRKISHCGLAGVQLHGQESPELVARLSQEGVLVIKALFAGGRPALEKAGAYSAGAFLVECAKGPLPGGNAMAWDWKSARPFGSSRPMILAGGLTPENISSAIAAARPCAVDVSSGVESAPGRKDIEKVARFIEKVAGCRWSGKFPVFQPK